MRNCKTLHIVLVVIALLLLSLVASAQDGEVRRSWGDGLQIGSSGSWVNYLETGTISLGASATTGTLTLTGAATGDQVWLSPTTAWGSTTEWRGTVSATNTILVTLDQAAGSTISFNVLVVGKP